MKIAFNLFLIFVVLILCMISSASGNVNNITVDIHQQFMYDIDMTTVNGSSNGTIYEYISSKRPITIIKREFNINFIINEPYYKIDLNNHNNETLTYKDKEYTLVLENKSNGYVLIKGVKLINNNFEYNFTLVNISTVSISPEIQTILRRTWEMGNSTYKEHGLLLAYVPKFKVSYTYNTSNEPIKPTKRVQVNLLSNGYNFSKFMCSSKPANYIYTQEKITSLIWNDVKEYEKFIVIESKTKEATSEKLLDNATRNSEKLGEESVDLGNKSILMGHIAILIAIISFVSTFFIELNNAIHNSPTKYNLKKYIPLYTVLCSKYKEDELRFTSYTLGVLGIIVLLIRFIQTPETDTNNIWIIDIAIYVFISSYLSLAGMKHIKNKS